ncbi:MAG: hypothetical protein ACKOPG_07940 [Novosphingobium sp.]
MADFLFTQFAAQNINANTDLVTTSGRSTKGVALASYVCDSLASAALLAAHPRFVAQSANGRFFRAVPTSGALNVELGGAVGDGLSDDQPAIQATIAYAEAIGVRTINFSARTYRLRCPVRTSDPAGQIGQHFYDGRPLVVSTPMVLRSTCHGGSSLVFRHVDGSPRQTNWQVVNSASTGQPMLWRGGGIFVRCPSVAPADYADRPGITLIDMTLDGGIPRGAVYEWPARISDGEGWDATDKGIEIEPDRYSGDVRLIRSKIIGFRGELIYQAGEGNGELYMRSAVLGETNGDLFQACGTNIDIDGLLGYKGLAPYEGWSGRRGRMVNTVFEDCVRTGGLAGGRVSPGINRNAPLRMADGLIPWLALDAEFRNCGPVMFGSWVRGRLKLTDSYLLLDGEQVYGEGLHDVDLEVVAQVDKLTGFAAVVLVGSSTPGKQTLSDVRIRLRCSRSAEARANGRAHQQPVDYRGSMGPNVIIEKSSGEAERASGPSGTALTAVTDHFPCFRDNRWLRTTGSWTALNQDISANPQIVPRADLMVVYANAAGTWPMTMPVAGIQHGHELTVRNLSGGGIFASLAANGAGATLPATRVLAPGSQMSLCFDQEAAQWREIAPPPPLTGSAAPAIAAIAAGDVSPEIAISCPGAAAGMTASVASASDLGDAFEVCAVRAAASAVRFRLRNNGAVAAAPSGTAWTVAAAYPA